MNQPVTIFVQTDQPLKIREPTSWNGTRGIGPIWGLVGQMMGFKRPLSRAASFTLASGSTEDGFGGLFPDLGLQEGIIFSAHIRYLCGPTRNRLGQDEGNGGGRVAETLSLGFSFHCVVTIFSTSDFQEPGNRKSEQSNTAWGYWSN